MYSTVAIIAGTDDIAGMDIIMAAIAAGIITTGIGAAVAGTVGGIEAAGFADGGGGRPKAVEDSGPAQSRTPSMPRYYFAVHSTDGRKIDDDEGIELSNDAAALAYARQVHRAIEPRGARGIHGLVDRGCCQ
jgi:hypothetical protein